MAQTAFRAGSRSALRAFNSRLRRLAEFDTSPHIRERNRDTACEQFTRKGIAGNRFAGKPLFAYSDKAGKDWIFEGVSLMWAATAFVLLTQVSANDQPVQPDIIIRGAMIYDGSGQPGRKGDLAIRGDRIVGVGAFQVAGKPREIDGSGLIVCPGFIDLHTHSDVPLTVPATKANLCYLMQGVTTVVTGNCGAGPVNVADYFRKLEAGGVGSNVIHQVYHIVLRNTS